MKLSINMISDRLAQFEPSELKEKGSLEIETVRLYSANVKKQKNTLYVGRQKELDGSENENVFLLHKDALQILNTTALDKVLNAVLDSLEYYFTWGDHMNALLSGNAMLQDLVDKSEELLQEPLFLLDAGQRLLAATKKYVPAKEDTFWWNLLDNKTGDLEILSLLNRRYSKRLQTVGIYQLNYDDMFPNEAYHYNFFSQKSWVGMATLINMSGTLSQGRLDLFLLFCDFVDAWFAAHIEDESSYALGSQLRMALDSDDYDSGELKVTLNMWGWKETDQLMLLRLDAPYTPYNINLHLCRIINNNFQNLFATTFNTSAVVLCNLTLEPWEEVRPQMIQWLRSSHYYGVQSPVFTLKDSVYLNYQYACLTADHCEKQTGEIYDGSKYRMDYMISYIKNGSLPDPCHPDIFKLMEYDKIHHTEYAYTLKVYLEQERNHVATAQKLTLHRNSLAYRISKIQSMIDANLDDPRERLHLLISFALQDV